MKTKSDAITKRRPPSAKKSESFLIVKVKKSYLAFYLALLLLITAYALQRRLNSNTYNGAEQTMSLLARIAFERAETRECKDKIAELDRLNRAGQLYPGLDFKSTCPYGNASSWFYVGCYHGITDIVDYGTEELLAELTPQRCVQWCYSMGSSYAALTRGTYCTCLQSLQRSRDQLVADLYCDIPCAGDPQQTCGDRETYSVYSTGSAGVIKFAQQQQPNRSTRPARIAFLLQFNGRNARQIGRLLRLIYRPEHFYFIHVDKRAHYLYGQIERMIEGLANVHLALERFEAVWSGASLLNVILSGYRYVLLERPDWHWDFVVNLSESDFPIRPIEDLAHFLGANQAVSFAQCYTNTVAQDVAWRRFQFTNFECENRVWWLDKRPLLRGLRLVIGGDWLLLNRAFVSYVINGLFVEKDPFLTDLLHYHQHTLAASEHFFHIVAANSRFCDSIVSNFFRWFRFTAERSFRNKRKDLVDMTFLTGSPYAPKQSDFDEIFQQAKTNFFIRKVDESIDQGIANLIEMKILKSLTEPPSAVDTFWLNEFHVAFDRHNSRDENRQLYYEQFVRLAKEKITNNSESSSELVSVNVLKIRNQFEGFIVEFNVKEMGTFETLIRSSEASRRKAEALKRSLESQNAKLTRLFAYLNRRITSLGIGSNFNWKENVFEPAVPLFVAADEPNNVCVSIGWDEINPSLQSAPVVDVDVTLTLLIGDDFKEKTICQNERIRLEHADDAVCVCAGKLYLNEPGIWRASVRIDNTLVKIDDNEPYTFEFPVLNTASDNTDTSLEIEAWANALVAEFWSAEDVCVVSSSEVSNKGKLMEPCSAKSWSSYYPDVKSNFSPYKF